MDIHLRFNSNLIQIKLYHLSFRNLNFTPTNNLLSKFSHIYIVGSRFGGSFHCRCEQTQTQQAQYNEFGREAGSRTKPLRGLRQRSGRIVREQDRQRRSWGGSKSVLGPRPRRSFSSSPLILHNQSFLVSSELSSPSS